MKRITADGQAEKAFLQMLKARQEETDPSVVAQVAEIIDAVRLKGDAALSHYSERFDGFSGPPRFLSAEDFAAALERVDQTLVAVMRRAAENIAAFHRKQLSQGFRLERNDGAVLGQLVRPLERVGLYVPGGRAAYPSSVLMNAIPAKIAGVRELIMTTPPSQGNLPPDVILAAAAIAGVDRVLLAGGAQACAALAYGTETVPQVDKLTGPGNIYVATAKRLLFGVVDIDMIAGPSEILVIADESANPRWVAADLLSQCEHDPQAAAILVTDSAALADAVEKDIQLQTARAPRREIIEQSLAQTSAMVLVEDIDAAIDFANKVAPEHLELVITNAWERLEDVRHAGSVFLGAHTPEAVGDYFSGTNHVLPTSGTARFFSPLGVDSFLRRMQYSSYTSETLEKDGKDIIAFAESEGLHAHAASVKVRLSDEN